LRNLSAQALGQSTSVRCIARLPYAGISAAFEPPAAEADTVLSPAAPVAAAPPRMVDRPAMNDQATADNGPPLPFAPQYHRHDPPRSVHAMTEPTQWESATFIRMVPIEPVAAKAVSAPPVLVPTAAHVAPSSVFFSVPPAEPGTTTAAHRYPGTGETTEVHVSIGRIELTAVHEASPPSARRATPAKPTLPLHEYLARRQRRPS
jgi:hypothetical protein